MTVKKIYFLFFERVRIYRNHWKNMIILLFYYQDKKICNSAIIFAHKTGK